MMNGAKLVKKFLLPCGLCAAIPVVKAEPEKPVKCSNEAPAESKRLIRPSELPLYTFEKVEPAREIRCKEPEPNLLEQGFGTVRKSVQDFLGIFTGYTSVITNTIDTGVAHSQVTLDYLREETNVLPRIGAVGVGGLAGLILGLRGGKFKKLVYTSTGAITVASICYPKQAEEGLTLAKYYINIGYNFLYGVKPGDPNQMQISWPEFPKIPTNFAEVKDLAGTAASSATSAAGTLVSKAIQAFNEFSESPVPPHEKEQQAKKEN